MAWHGGVRFGMARRGKAGIRDIFNFGEAGFGGVRRGRVR